MASPLDAAVARLVAEARKKQQQPGQPGQVRAWDACVVAWRTTQLTFAAVESPSPGPAGRTTSGGAAADAGRAAPAEQPSRDGQVRAHVPPILPARVCVSANAAAVHASATCDHRPKRVHTPPVNKNFLLRVVQEADNHNERLLYDEHFRSQARLNAVEDRSRSATRPDMCGRRGRGTNENAPSVSMDGIRRQRV